MASSTLTAAGALDTEVALSGVTTSNTQVFTNGTGMKLRASFTHSNSGFTPFFITVAPGESIHFISGYAGSLSVTVAPVHTASGYNASASSDVISQAENVDGANNVIGAASETSGTRRAGARVFLSLE